MRLLGWINQRNVDVGVAGLCNDWNEPAVFGSGTFPIDIRHYHDGFHGFHRKANQTSIGGNMAFSNEYG